MPPGVVQVHYGQLETVRRGFSEWSEKTDRLVARLTAQVDVLKKGAWEGENADKFYAEMDLVLPALQRVCQSFDDAVETCATIQHVFNDAEEEAGRCFPDYALITAENFADATTQPYVAPADRVYP